MKRSRTQSPPRLPRILLRIARAVFTQRGAPWLWRLAAVLPTALRRGPSAARLELERIRSGSLRDWRQPAHPHHAKALRFPFDAAPRVSIVVPAYNDVAHTASCLHSILEARSEAAYEVIVVDDASTDRTPELLGGVENLTVIRFDRNRGFIDACNAGIDAAKGDEILLLNNDTRVTDGWLDALLRVFDDHPDCAAVGPKLLFPNGLLQEAGGIVWRGPCAENFGKFDDPGKPEYNFVREVDYVSGAALLVRADVLDGGLDERYSPGFWEDVDLCFRVRRRGYKVMFQPSSVVLHLEGASGWRDSRAGMELLRRNASAFGDRWSEELRQQFSRTKRNLFLARDRNRNPAALVVGRRSPAIDPATSSLATHNLLLAFRNRGYRVVFWPASQASPGARLSDLEQRGIEVIRRPRNFRLFSRETVGIFSIAVLCDPESGGRHEAYLRSRVQEVVHLHTDSGELARSRETNAGQGRTVDSKHLELWRKLHRTAAELLREASPAPRLQRELRAQADRLVATVEGRGQA